MPMKPSSASSNLTVKASVHIVLFFVSDYKEVGKFAKVKPRANLSKQISCCTITQQVHIFATNT